MEEHYLLILGSGASKIGSAMSLKYHETNKQWIPHLYIYNMYRLQANHILLIAIS